MNCGSYSKVVVAEEAGSAGPTDSRIPVNVPAKEAQVKVPLMEFASEDAVPLIDKVPHTAAVGPVAEKSPLMVSIVPARFTEPAKSHVPVISRVIPD